MPIRNRWQALDQNARGQVTTFSLGNGVTTERDYDPLDGLVNTIQSGHATSTTNIQNLGFTFDGLGNLIRRTGYDQTGGFTLSEAFGYDKLNRLTDATVTSNGVAQTTQSYQYDALGNITYKQGVGNYSYGNGNAGPHAVTATSTGSGNKTYHYDANGNLIEVKDDGVTSRTINWSPYNKPTQIVDNGNTTQFVYGANRHRIRQINDEKTIYYVGGLFEAQREHGGQWIDVHYIKAGGSTVTVVKHIEQGDGRYARETRYLHKDHLGSVESMTDESGQLISQLSYDPHGKRRDSDWTDPIIPVTSPFTPRGFTGHEHLDNVGLIPMTRFVWNEPEPL